MSPKSSDMISDPAVLSTVISRLYDAALDPTKWIIALKDAYEFVGGAEANLFWQGSSAASDAGVFHIYNNDPFFTRLFLEQLAPLNPVFPAVLFQEVGAVHTFRDIVPWQEIQETRFHNEWIAPQGFTDSLAVVLERDAARLAILTFPWRNGEIGDVARQRLALLVPHLQRAVAIGRLFVRREAEAAALTETLDGVGEAVFLLARDRRIAFANARARALAEDGGLLRIGEGHLAASDPEADRALAGALGAVASGSPVDVQGVSVVLEDGPDGRWTAHLLPFADTAGGIAGEAHRACAALYVRHAHAAEVSPLETLARQHGLTASEIRVVDATLRVTGLDGLADELGISRATVKTHLNRIYRKVKARNQAELIQIVAGLVSARSDP